MRPSALHDALLGELAARFGTPLFVYDAATIRARLAELAPFDRVRYAQKANPNLSILALLCRAGAAVDAVSAGEIERALAAGFPAADIVFTADLFDRAALELVARHGLHVNCGSTDMLAQLAERVPGAAVSLRVNPGFGHGHHAKVTTGGEASKHGIWHAELAHAAARARELGLRVSGLHVHIGSGSSAAELARAAEALERAARLAGDSLDSLSAGGGLPVPYRESDERFDVAAYASAWRAARARVERELGRAIELEVEPGRFLVAEAGVLLAEVRATKRQGAIEFALVDAGFHNLIRPALYGAFHRIAALSKDNLSVRPTVVAGPLCESADVFTQGQGGALAPQMLPALAAGDRVCIEDAGAYGASMASHYNSQPFAAEVLVDGASARLIRPRETLAELFAAERELLET